jgi:hypothetical protein
MMPSSETYVNITMPRICTNCANKPEHGQKCQLFRDAWAAVRSGLCPWSAWNVERKRAGRPNKVAGGGEKMKDIRGAIAKK